MSQQKWTAVDDYISSLYGDATASNPALEASALAGLPAISVSPAQGQLLSLLARVQETRAILEIGTLGGFSAIWLAQALPSGGRLVTLESEPTHVEVARANVAKAGLSEVVDIRLGAAVDMLPLLVEEYPNGFDLIFIDADKPSYPAYWRWALRLSHKGTLIIADNVVRDGAVVDRESDDLNVRAVRDYLALVAAEPGVFSTVVQTVGAKGYDGFSLAVVLDCSSALSNREHR